MLLTPFSFFLDGEGKTIINNEKAAEEKATAGSMSRRESTPVTKVTLAQTTESTVVHSSMSIPMTGFELMSIQEEASSPKRKRKQCSDAAVPDGRKVFKQGDYPLDEHPVINVGPFFFTVFSICLSFPLLSFFF